MILQIIKLKSNLEEEELIKRAKLRAPQFESISGLIQKYYSKMGDGSYAGVYIWDSQASIVKFKESELAKSIPAAYEIIEAPDIEILDILFQLRE